MNPSKAKRFEIFLERISAAPAAHSAAEARALIANTLDGVESEFTDIPYAPSQWKTDGRMYPPQEDSARRVAGHSDVTRYRTAGHNTYVGENGAIRIDEIRSRATVLDLSGADTCRIDLS